MHLSPKHLHSLWEQLAGNSFPITLKYIQPVYLPGKQGITPSGFNYSVELTADSCRFLNVFIRGKCQIDRNTFRDCGRLHVCFTGIHYRLKVNPQGYARLQFFADSIKILSQ